MAKKKETKNYLAYLPIISLAVGMIGGFVRFQAQAETTKTKVEELNGEVKELTNKSKELDKQVEVNKTQQNNTEKKVEEVNQKTDKIIDLLMQMQKKK